MNLKIQVLIILAFMLLLQPAHAQFTGGDGRGDYKDATSQTLLSGEDGLFSGGDGRGDYALTATGLMINPCFNPTNGGEIGSDQTICYSETPAPLTNITLPTGQSGTLEYKWQYSVTGGSSGFADIANSNAAGYTPGSLTDTTWFRRLARVDCMPDWTGCDTSNVVKITIVPLFITTQAVTAVTATTATGNGNLTSVCGSEAENRGIIWYPFSDSLKLIGDYQVTNVDNTGSFSAGTFSIPFSGLAANSRYSVRAHANNTNGTAYGTKVDFWTLANVPAIPTVNNPQPSSLDVTINTNGNPDTTTYAIQDSISGKYVQTDGTLGDDAAWQKASLWGTKTVTGLTTGTTYKFRAKAKNGGGIESAFGLGASGIPMDKPTVELVSDAWLETGPTPFTNRAWFSVSTSSNGSKMLAGDTWGRLYMSADAGANWTETGPTPLSNKSWKTVSTSSDGNIMVAGVNGGRLYVSADAGTTWAETRPAGDFDKNWSSVKISPDGSKLYAAAGSGRLYMSANGGTSWVETGPAPLGNKDWYSIDASFNGSIILAGTVSGKIYKTTDGGLTWAETQPTGIQNNFFPKVALSSDGTKIIVCYNGGRIYQSTNGGQNWSETGPLPLIDNSWCSISMSSNGDIILAGIEFGRLYQSTDGGSAWSEIQPGGNVDKVWYAVAVSYDGSQMIAGAALGDRLYRQVKPVTGINSTSAIGNGRISNLNGGGDATNRGIIYYPYTNTDKIIGDANVTNVSTNGTFGIDYFSTELTGLSVNTHYNLRAHATNSAGTGYSDRSDFWTLANVPSAPTVNNFTLTSLDVTINTNSNPDTTTYAVQDSITGKYVQTDGTLGDDAAWRKASLWGTITMTGLTTGTTYNFRVKARNAENIETAFSPGTEGKPSDIPTVVSFVDIQGYETRPAGDVDKAWASVSVSDDGSVMLAGTEDSRLYLTATGGNSWTETQPAGDINNKWRAVSVSGDGNILLASVYDGRLYYSTNTGANWNEALPAGSNNQYWNAVAISENGERMLTGGSPGRLYYSDNTGASWTEKKLAGDVLTNWSSVSISGDGTKMLACVYNGRLFVSTNSAGAWTELKFAGDEDKLWNTTAISQDGSTMLAGMTDGRLYLSTDGGTTWNETQPAGNADKRWRAASISEDGKIIVVNDGYGRLHYSTNQGADWIEAQPLGNIDAPWTDLSMTGDASKILIAMYPGRLLVGEPAPFSNITQTTTTATGDITFVNGENATNRGFIWYPYTDTDKVIGDADVTNVDEDGNYGPGDFSVSITGLSINSHYNGRAHATNDRGTGYGVRADLWTLANVPGKPDLDNLTANSADVTLDVNSNPAYTEFAVKVVYDDGSKTLVEKYVNANGGNLQNEADWQINAVWGTKTITGLNTEIEYSVSVKARNGDHVETAFSDTANALLTDVPDVVSSGVQVWNEISPAGQINKDWMCTAISGDGNTLLSGVYNGRLFLSTDRGITWAEIRPGGDADLKWYGLSISDDGSVMMASVNGKRLYISLNGGTSWSETRPKGDDNGSWYSVSVSPDGSVMWTSDRYLYRSTDHGVNWTIVKPLGDTQKDWTLTAVSQDGSKVAAANDEKGGWLYLSNDGGTTFTATQPFGDLRRAWSSLSMSADGNTMLLSAEQGRLYLTTDGGTTWNEAQPAGANDKFWFRTSVSYDGQTMLAGILGERLYLSPDGGVSWSETQPAGNADLFWAPVAVSGDTTVMLAGVYQGRLYLRSGVIITDITATTATAHGQITKTNGFNADNRGYIWYPFTDTDKVIGDSDVTNVNEPGDFGTGVYQISLTGLSSNTHYNARAYATNDVGTGYGDRVDFWTLANVPGKPDLDNLTPNSMDVTIDVNSNPEITEYAIRVTYDDGTKTIVEKYVNAAAGNLQNDADWQPIANWGTKTITGLNTEIEYSVSVKARNSENKETAFSDTANALLTDVPIVVSGGETEWRETTPAGQVNKDWRCTAISGDGNTLLSGVYNGRLYLSRNGGIAWAETRPGGDADLGWYSVSISDDGSVMMAAVNPGRLYYSTDGGANWSETRPEGDQNQNWSSVSVSADGSVLWASSLYLYKSSDYGVNWNTVRPDPFPLVWISMAVSQNGSKVAAIHSNTEGWLYISDNGGLTFTPTQLVGNIGSLWSSLSMSADGNTMLLSAEMGRLYLTTDGGLTWNETQPAGDADRFWSRTSVSYDGQTMLAGIFQDGLYLSTDGGTSWSETQPAGNLDLPWHPVSVSGDASVMLAGYLPGRLYLRSGVAISDITATTATAHGQITKTNGFNADNRGYIWYPFTGTDKLIGDSDVTNVTEPGDFGIGIYQTSLTGLSVNTHYNARAHATNDVGTGYGSRVDFWTLANVPSAPTVDNPTATTLDVAVNVNGNPAGTEFLIHETTQSKYVQADGTLGVTAVWATATTWGTKTVTGLTTGTTYTFEVKARNSENTETAYGASANGTPEAAPTVTTQAASAITTTSATGNGNITATNGISPTNRGIIYYPYTDTDKEIGDTDVTNVAEDGSPSFGTGAFTASLTVLSVNTQYNARAHATNTMGTGYGDRVDFWTLANVPSAPTVDNAQLTSLDVTINTNGNPDTTLFAIQDSITGKYVQAGGTLGDNAAWQKASEWENITVTGLTTGTTYNFRAKAKNVGGVETAFGLGASGIPMDKPTVEYPFSINWAETQPNGDTNYFWFDVATSYDGNKMMAMQSPGKLYFSSDGGTSWNETQPAPAIDKMMRIIAISADGSTLVAGFSAGRLYKSTNDGASWSEIGPTPLVDNFWNSVSISSDGSKMLAGLLSGHLYLSGNGGTTWNEVKPAGNTFNEWSSVSVSADGNKMLAANYPGRIYLSTNGGTDWSEVGPVPFEDKYWQVSISGDGNNMVAAVSNGRIYRSTDGGANWTETMPEGSFDKMWYCVSVSADGTKMFASIYLGRQYLSIDHGATWAETGPTPIRDSTWVSSAISGDGNKIIACNNGQRVYIASNNSINITNITSTSATGIGKIKNLNGGGDATNRGMIYYPYTNTSKIIGDANVTNVSTNGTFGIGDFTADLTGLSVNTHYNLRAHATNTVGTGYSDRADFWTLANVPSAPTVDNPTATTLDVAVNVNGNPESTQFSIHETTTDLFVQADGTLGATAVWVTATTWGTKTITDLTVGTEYTFEVKARNGDEVETAFGASASGTPADIPEVIFKTDIIAASIPGNKTWYSTKVSADGTTMLAAVFGGRIYRSISAGVAWEEVQPAGDTDMDWTRVAVSGNGDVMLVAGNYTRVYKSADKGNTWNEVQPAGDFSLEWGGLNVSDDGLVMLAVESDGRIYRSTDGGSTWDETQPAGNLNKSWTTTSMSGDGQYLLAGVYADRLYVSSDYGQSWTETQPRGNVNTNWNCSAINTDGSTMLAGIGGGRLYLSNDFGTTWSETQPAGNADKTWVGISPTEDGQIIWATAYKGRIYQTTDAGSTWTEKQPAGDANKNWNGISVSSDGASVVTSVYGGLMYVSEPVFKNISNIAAETTGLIVSTNGGDVIHTGGIIYEYSDTDKIIGDAGVTQVDSTGTFGTVEFPVSFAGLTSNTHYNARVYATNYKGTGYSARSDFWTLANVPGQPTLDNVTANSIDVILDTNANPAYTEFAVKVTYDDGLKAVVTKYIQSGTGAMQNIPDWQTNAVWGTTTVGSLETGKEYTFAVKARNGDFVETAFGASESAITCSNPTNGGEIGSDQTIEYLTSPLMLTSTSGASGYGGILEYLWQSSTESDSTGFTDISNSNSATYQAGSLSDTTWFRRLARVDCKPDWTGAAESNVVKIIVVFRQHILIPQGWSYISSYIDPHNPNIVSMFAEIVGENNLGILAGVQGIYAPPPLYINTLGTWDVLKGYKVKMTAQDELIVTGDTLTDNTITFPAGVHLIPVLTNQTSGIDLVFDDPSNDINYMLDIYSNKVYWPNGTIFTLTELVPGKGYLANLKNAVTLTYPPLNFDTKGSSGDSEFAKGPWPCIRTANAHLISISAKAVKDLPNADYIGAFDSQGNCVGYAELEKTGQNILLTVYGDEPMTAENDGLIEGELLRFRSFSLGDNAEKELTATFNPTFPNADGLFYVNGISGISGFKESSTGLGENNLAASVEIYPNPAKDMLNITLTGFKTLSGLKKGLTATLLTAEGKLVKTFSITSPTTQLDVSDLQTGIYLLKITSENQIVVKRLVKQ